MDSFERFGCATISLKILPENRSHSNEYSNVTFVLKVLIELFFHDFRIVVLFAVLYESHSLLHIREFFLKISLFGSHFLQPAISSCHSFGDFFVISFQLANLILDLDVLYVHLL